MTTAEANTIKECIVALNGYYPLIKHIPDVAEGMNITIDKLERLVKSADDRVVYDWLGYDTSSWHQMDCKESRFDKFLNS